MVSGTDALNTLSEFNVMTPVPEMIIPPFAIKGVIHSEPAIRAVDVLY